MARRYKKFLTEHSDEVQHEEPDLADAEPLLDDEAWWEADWLDDATEDLSDEDDEDDELVIEVELFDDGEWLDTEE